MKLLDATPVSDEALVAIAARYRLQFDKAVPFPEAGIINTVYALGDDYVLRVPRNHPAHAAQAHREAVAIPAAVAAGVRTPRLIAFDDAKDILPVPYLIVERVPGVNLESLGIDPPGLPRVWHELGRDLARLHLEVAPAGLAGPPTDTPDGFADPRILVGQRVADGWISPVEARWLGRWLDRLAPLATHPVPRRFVHADVQMSNVLVDPVSHDYLGLVDWGCADWVDCAFDFLGMPVRAVPLLLAGHREIALLDDDETAEARILWRRTQLILNILPRGAAPGRSWGERPVAWLIDLLRFFIDAPNERWRSLAPEAF